MISMKNAKGPKEEENDVCVPEGDSGQEECVGSDLLLQDQQRVEAKVRKSSEARPLRLDFHV